MQVASDNDTDLAKAINLSLVDQSRTQIEQKAKKDAKEFVNKYSEDMKRYIATFDKRKSFSSIIKDLNLTNSEEKLLEEFIDPITMDYMDIPIILHGTHFNLNTIVACKLNPLTNDPFSKLEISSDRKFVERFDNLIKQIQNARKPSAGAASSGYFAGGPGGPGMVEASVSVQEGYFTGAPGGPGEFSKLP